MIALAISKRWAIHLSVMIVSCRSRSAIATLAGKGVSSCYCQLTGKGFHRLLTDHESQDGRTGILLEHDVEGQ